MRPAVLQKMVAFLDDWCRGVADGEDAASGWLKGSACSVVSRFMSLPPPPPPEPAYFPPYATRGGLLVVRPVHSNHTSTLTFWVRGMVEDSKLGLRNMVDRDALRLVLVVL